MPAYSNVRKNGVVNIKIGNKKSSKRNINKPQKIL
jgi:hypothetical protein